MQLLKIKFHQLQTVSETECDDSRVYHLDNNYNFPEKDLKDICPGNCRRFGHGLGHGVGLAIHEQPRLSPLSDKILAAGMVCTVEPGIYLPGWGGVRLENMIVVTDDGAEVLNKTAVDEVRLEA